MAEITVIGLPQTTAVAKDDTIHIVQSSIDKRATIQQVIDAISNTILPAGYILPAAWNNDPATLGIRALPLIGQGVLRASYSDLDTVVYCGDGSNATASSFYHADDINGTIRNTAGIYLIFPDSKGKAIRGYDSTGTIDPDGATRDIGSEQLDSLQRHGHSVYVSSGIPTTGASYHTRIVGGTIASDGATTGNAIDINSLTSRLGTYNTEGAGGTPRVGIESRMRNLAFNYMITY